ncbi:MAG TPA: DUF4012 domain-containing protein, partial [Legionellaceae bacterium]|nr:DUF4012 domain-containing protein [Legionellaceae bacterium]
NNLYKMGYLKYIPVASWYYNDADHLIKAGFDGLDAAITLTNSLKPYADVLGLKGQGSFVMGSAEQRIQTAIMTMGKITPRIDDISGALVDAQKEIDAVDPNHYPPFFGGQKIRSQLITARTVADEGVTFVTQAKPLIKVLPSLLGETQPKKYLVIFQNDKELRPTGGFITAYAIFSIDKGVISAERSDDIYTLDGSIPTSAKPKAPAPILKYLPNVSVLNLRDSNLSPDYIESMKTFQSLYNKASQKVAVDGIIAIDSHVLVSTVKVLDNKIEAGGLTFTTDPDDNCGGCPQIIYSLEDNISRPVGYIKEDRKGLLGQLLYAIMQKALKSSPKLYWGPLFQTFIAETNQKHVLFDIFNEDAQAGIEALNAAGRIKDFDGDYFALNEANFAGAKSNLFVQEDVTQNIQVQSDGSLVKTVTINYKNPFRPSDCNLERGNLCLNAPLRNWVRFYVPKGSTLTSSQGSEVKMTTYDELGKTVFEGFLTIRPLGAATLTITYKLPFKSSDGNLPLLIQKQPGKPGVTNTDGNSYTIQVNGKQVEQFPLISDKELKLTVK